jgi:serine/threonine protein kinase
MAPDGKDNPKNKDNILQSFYYQAIITLYWLYMKKGIVHKDINLDNFFIEKTNDKNLEITIGENTYNIKLYGYYLVLADFGHARSLELFDASDYPNNLSISFGSGDMNPYYEILTIINIFKKYIKLNFDEHILKLGMFNHNYSVMINTDYKNLLKSYIKSKDYDGNMKIFKKTLYKFKKKYSIFVNNYIK